MDLDLLGVEPGGDEDWIGLLMQDGFDLGIPDDGDLIVGLGENRPRNGERDGEGEP